MNVLIANDGTLQFVWSDELAALRDLGTAHTRRASHVEPTADSKWTADMGPMGGPVLGPFDLHQQAIQAERAWLLEHCGI